MSRDDLIVYPNPSPILSRLKLGATKDYSPTMLPAVSCVEIVVLHGVRPRRVGDSMTMAVNALSVAVQGATALRIAQLWRDLPQGHQARCHIPPFGLRFIAERELICQGSICWECNNIIGDVGGVSFLYEFAAEAEPSQALLTELRRIVGDDQNQSA